MKLEGLGQRALKKTILAAMLLGSVNAAHAIINIDVSFDGENTLMEVSGSWDSFTPTNFGSKTLGESTPSSLMNLSGNVFSASSGLTLASGDALPTFSFTPVGDSFGFNDFDGGTTYAPYSYSAGDSIAAAITVATDVFGLVAVPVQGGTYTGGGSTLNWSAVPEPSTYAALLGCMALGVALVRRKRG